MPSVGQVNLSTSTVEENVDKSCSQLVSNRIMNKKCKITNT